MIPLRRKYISAVLAWTAASMLVAVLPSPVAGQTSSGPKTPPKSPLQTGVGNHWGTDSVGFEWTEGDSRDDRWRLTDLGRWMASSLPLPNKRGTVEKALSIRVGASEEAAVCYDVATMKLRAAWTGGFLQFTPARYGLISPPSIAGTTLFASDGSLAWPQASVRYVGLHRNGDRVVLRYRVASVGSDAAPIEIRESPWFSGGTFFRSLEIGPGAALTLAIAEAMSGEKAESKNVAGRAVVVVPRGERTLVFATVGDGVALKVDAGAVVAAIPERAKRSTFRIAFGETPAANVAAFVDAAAKAPGDDCEALAKPGPARWTASIVTKGILGKDDAGYVVDTVTLPFENPYKALFFVGGHDFLPNGDVALCTVHGDVWLAKGVGASLDRVTWKRFATGLYQPLGLRVVGGKIHVLGRDQITRLHDFNGDDEADFYENFCNLGRTSPGGHDYSTCLETDSRGAFLFMTATEGVVRVSPDGSKREVVASGFRNPNGMGVGPGDEITVAPQEGEWTPGSKIDWVEPWSWHGYGGPRVTPERPLGYDPPLVWIPRRSDNSSGGQVWAPKERWGPLSGQLLHLSFGQCRMLLTLRDEPRPGVVQGAVVELPHYFQSGVMRGRFSPHDGQLYVSGLKGWTTSATQDGCLQRVRYTGKPADLPVKMQTFANGVALTFARPLDKTVAEDPDSYAAEQWNYKYSAAYGSPDWKVADPKQIGHDEVAIASATLADDGRTVFLEIPSIRPVHQLAIGYALAAAGGQAFRGTAPLTIHALASAKRDPSKLVRIPPADGLTDEARSALKPGLLVRFEQQDRKDVRVDRLAALRIAPNESVSSLTAVAPTRVRFEGFVKMPLRGEVAFSWKGRADVHIRGKAVVPAQEGEPVRVPLARGMNAVAIELEVDPKRGSDFRLYWEGDEFPREPVPPNAWFHRSDDAALAASARLRSGIELWESRRCAQCHDDKVSVDALPHLKDVGSRVRPEWMFRWILEPASVRNHATMPILLDPADPDRRQKAADLTAYLATLRDKDSAAAPVPKGDARSGALLYEDQNCIACHRFTPPADADPFGRTSLAYVGTKHPDGLLEAFLLRPHERFAERRMPDFRLSPQVAADLAAHLRRESKGTIGDADEWKRGDAGRGAKLFEAVGCMRCHAVSEDAPTRLPPIPIVRGEGAGCLAEPKERGRAPLFPLKADERHALAELLRVRRRGVGAEPPTEIAERLIERLSCRACHGRDAKQGSRWEIIEEEGRGVLPESIPSLTWTGEKLKARWMAEFIAGKGPHAVRPVTKTRMPGFPAFGQKIASGIAGGHGIAPEEMTALAVDAGKAEIGSKLTQKAALDCRQCHSVSGEALVGDAKTLLAVGIPFHLAKDRLREEYFRRFVLDPIRYDPLTRMPKFAADGRSTKVRDYFDGNAERQIDALWHFLQSVEPKRKGP